MLVKLRGERGRVLVLQPLRVLCELLLLVLDRGRVRLLQRLERLVPRRLRLGERTLLRDLDHVELARVLVLESLHGDAGVRRLLLERLGVVVAELRERVVVLLFDV